MQESMVFETYLFVSLAHLDVDDRIGMITSTGHERVSHYYQGRDSYAKMTTPINKRRWYIPRLCIKESMPIRSLPFYSAAANPMMAAPTTTPAPAVLIGAAAPVLPAVAAVPEPLAASPVTAAT